MSFGEKLLAIEIPVDEIVPPLLQAFQALGVGAHSSFDLRSACAPHHSPCPHHGTLPCSCQLVVLMLYDWQGEPYALTLHGCEGQTEFALRGTDEAWRELIRGAIRHAAENAGEVEASEQSSGGRQRKPIG